MKISNYIGTFALVAMLTACSTEEEQVHFAGNEVKVNAAIGRESTFTRSNPAGDEVKQSNFNDYDQIGISMNDGAARLYEMKNGIWDVKDGEPLKWETEITEFMAFYPYSYGDKLYNSFEKGHIIENQISKEGMALSDYMIAGRSEASFPANRELELYFLRKTARVIVDIQNSTFTNEFDSPLVSGVTIFSQLEIPATQGADVTEIKPYKMDDSNPKSSWMALVAPDAEDANKDFICISVQENGTGTPKAYSIKGIPNLESGMSYTYQLKIGKDKAIIDNVTVTDWKEGTAIPGGEASLVTEESVRESVAKQLENGNYVELTLPSNASLGLFEAIKTALEDKGVPKGQVNITLKGVMTIPEKAFGNLSEGVAPWVVSLPDATIIDDNAFQGSTLAAIYAPKVEEINSRAFSQCEKLGIVDMRKASRIGSMAFEGCNALNRVRFGALSSVGVAYDDGTGGIFNNFNTEGVDLTLSSRQSMMELRRNPEEATYEWVPAGGSYWDTEDYKRTKFLGYKFNHIYRADD